MNIVGAVFCEFDESFLGGTSALERELAGATVLERTVRRLLRVKGLTRRVLVTTPTGAAEAQRLLAPLLCDGRVQVLACDPGGRPRRRLIRAARKWNLAGWRGTLLNTTWFDEFVEPEAVARVFNETQADAVLCVSGAQPLLDPELADDMLAALRARSEQARMIFTQAPPGLAGVVLTRDVARELVEHNWPLGLLLTYRPELPRMDPITSPDCFRVDPLISQTPARWCADTRRSFALAEAALRDCGEDATALALSAWVRAGGAAANAPAALPEEIEVELTTADPLPETTLRTRGERVPRRALGEHEALPARARELAAFDDSRIVLGGAGDPLQHPRFVAICEQLRTAGVGGLAVTTPLVDLSAAQLAALTDVPVDVLEVQLDAHTAETYARVHRRDAFAQVVANIDRVLDRRKQTGSPEPIVVPSITRCAATLGEIEAFYEYWIRRGASPVIRGYSTFGGALPSDTLLPAVPPVRSVCRRAAGAVLMADGGLTACGEDIEGVQRTGDGFSQTLAEWGAGRARAAFVARHESLTFDAEKLCASCGAWAKCS